jgi:hypothetical protein
VFAAGLPNYFAKPENSSRQLQVAFRRLFELFRRLLETPFFRLGGFGVHFRPEVLTKGLV